MLKVKILKEVYSDKQRKYMCAMAEPDANRPEDLSQAEAEEMCSGPMKKEEQLEEISSMGGGAVAVAAGEPEELEEMYSTMGLKPSGPRHYVDELGGYKERAEYLGLKNASDHKKKIKIKLRRKKKLKLNENSSTAEALIKFANIGHIKSKRKSLWIEFLEKYGLETLIQAIKKDDSASSRIDFIKNELHSTRDFDLGLQNKDENTIRDYYDFLMNEYLFWSYYNPHASPVRYADSAVKVPSAAKNLIRGHISRYISNPSRNNPAALSRRSIGKDSSSQKIYKDKPTLDDPLYNLPE